MLNVKRCILFFALCSLFLTPGKAQPRLHAKEFYIGVHGGVTASTVYFRPTIANMKPITNACMLGGNGGLVFRYAGHKYCAFQMELNYEHRGWAEKSDAGSYSRSLHYVELPIFMHLNFGNEVCKWFFNLGPQIGYCVKDEGNSGTLVNGTGSYEYDPMAQRFDWGLAAGTGFYVQTRRAGLYQLEVRFDYSFGGVYGTRATDHFRMASPMDLSINLAYMWKFTKRKKI